MSKKREYTSQQIAIIRRKKIEEAARKKAVVLQDPQQSSVQKEAPKKTFPDKFPFWARFRMSKQRTTLVIDEEPVINKKTKLIEEGYVHREATHTEKKDYEKIYPNPDKTDPDPMYLKRPRKHPKKLFEPHNKNLDMPEHLRERYDKNNKKDK